MSALYHLTLTEDEARWVLQAAGETRSEKPREAELRRAVRQRVCKAVAEALPPSDDPGKPVVGARAYTVHQSGKVIWRGAAAHTRMTSYGTKTIRLTMDDGYSTTRTVCRLVGQAFCPDYHPDLYPVYADGNTNNCSAENLTWKPLTRAKKS